MCVCVCVCVREREREREKERERERGRAHTLKREQRRLIARSEKLKLTAQHYKGTLQAV